MVKYVKFKYGSGTIHKMSEREYNMLIERGESLTVVKSVTRKPRQPRKQEGGFGFSGFKGFSF